MITILVQYSEFAAMEWGSDLKYNKTSNDLSSISESEPFTSSSVSLNRDVGQRGKSSKRFVDDLDSFSVTDSGRRTDQTRQLPVYKDRLRTADPLDYAGGS